MSYIQLYNVFAQEGCKYHLSVEELYVYSLLCIMRNREYETITNVEVIHQYSPIQFYSKDHKSKQCIIECLVSLKEKKVIEFECKFNNNKSDYNKLIEIKFYDDLRDNSIGKKGVKGYENVSIEKFRTFESIIDFYIYFTVIRFDNIENVEGFKCDYMRWGLILNLSPRRVQDKLDDAFKKKFIYINHGEYTEELTQGRNQKRQAVNTYSTIPFDEDTKSKMTKKKEAIQNKEIENGFNEMFEDSEKMTITNSNSGCKKVIVANNDDFEPYFEGSSENEPKYDHIDGMNDFYKNHPF